MKKYSEETRRELLSIVSSYYHGDMRVGEISHADELMDFAISHQLNALFCHMVLSDASVTAYDTARVRQAYLMNVQTNMAIGMESQKFGEYLRGEGIRYAYIKGQYIKNYYEPIGVRSMGDADIYVPKADMDAVYRYFEAHGYSEGEYYAGVHTFNKGKMSFEVHNEIEWFGVDWSTKCELTESGYSMRDEIALTIIHALKHIAGFGCGMRQVLDIALLLREDASILTDNAFLRDIDSIGMTKCFSALIGVINKWFDVQYPHTVDTEAEDVLAMSIIDGGVFGKNINDYATVNTAMNKSKCGMYFRMLFPTMERMCLAYPRLRTHKYLIGYYYAKRLIDKGLRKKKYKAVHSSVVSEDSLENRKKYVEILGISGTYYDELK